MNCNELVEDLMSDFSKRNILRLSDMVIQHEISVKNLLDLCFLTNEKIAFRAAWVLEKSVDLNFEIIHYVLPDFLSSFSRINNESVQRHFTKIFLFLIKKKNKSKFDFSFEQVNPVFSQCMIWLIDNKKPVAIRANCLEIAYYLSCFENWILDEITAICESFLLEDSAALRSRSKAILKKINLENY